MMFAAVTKLIIHVHVDVNSYPWKVVDKDFVNEACKPTVSLLWSKMSKRSFAFSFRKENKLSQIWNLNTTTNAMIMKDFAVFEEINHTS